MIIQSEALPSRSSCFFLSPAIYIRTSFVFFFFLSRIPFCFQVCTIILFYLFFFLVEVVVSKSMLVCCLIEKTCMHGTCGAVNYSDFVTVWYVI